MTSMGHPSNTTPVQPSPTLQPSHKGRTIGIAVGVSVGVLALAVCAILLFFWTRRRHRKQNENIGQATSETAAVDGYGNYDRKVAAIVDSIPIPELEGYGIGGYGQNQAAVPAPIPVVELEGHSYLSTSR
jgi:hypothetical protein